MEVGGEEAEASRGGGNLILLVDGEAVRRRRAARALGRLNRGTGERPGRLGRLGWLGAKGGRGLWVAEAQGEARALPPPLLFLFFKQLLHFLFFFF